MGRLGSELHPPVGNILPNHQPRHVLPSPGFRDVFAAGANHHHQLALVIDMLAAQFDVSPRPHEARGKLREHQGIIRHVHGPFSRMGLVVQANGKRVPWPRYGGAELSLT